MLTDRLMGQHDGRGACKQRLVDSRRYDEIQGRGRGRLPLAQHVVYMWGHVGFRCWSVQEAMYCEYNLAVAGVMAVSCLAHAAAVSMDVRVIYNRATLAPMMCICSADHNLGFM
jgi:hypothetical protein